MADEPDVETQPTDSGVVADDASDDEAELRLVRYDLDNSGRVDLGDLAFFASVYREKLGVTTENPYAYAADYDGSETVDLGDLALFAAEYQLSRANDLITHPVEVSQSSSAAVQTALTTAEMPVETASEQSAEPMVEQPTEQTNETITETPAYELTKKTSTLLPGDANRDGLVSADDYASIQANFGNHLPEPATLGLLAIAGVMVMLVRRRAR